MGTKIGAVLAGVTAFIAIPVFAQSIAPSKLDPRSPIGTPFFHIFSCYDIHTGNLLNCHVLDELVPPVSNPAHPHSGTFPLTDLSVGANGFVRLSCTDFNSDPFIVQTFTNGSTALVLHTIPQFSGIIRVRGSVTPPPGWSCVTTCNFLFTEDIGVDGLSDLPPGPHYAVIRSPSSLNLHPHGSAGTSDTLLKTISIAQAYALMTGRGLSINDLSLPRGGKFDLSGIYNEDGEHSSHRTGKDVDFNSTDLGGQTTNCLIDKQFQQILDANHVSFRTCHTGGAYHVRFH